MDHRGNHRKNPGVYLKVAHQNPEYIGVDRWWQLKDFVFFIPGWGNDPI